MIILKKTTITAMFVALICTNIVLAQNSVINLDAINSLGGDSISVESARAEFYPFAKIKDYESGDINSSHFYQPLNNQLKYKILDPTDKISSDVYDTDFNDSSWKNYSIGANLLSESKIRDQKGKFSAEIPNINNSVVFRTTFKVPMTWDEREVFISLSRVAGSSTIYVNGKKVGYSEDSKAINNFKVTKMVKEGLNSLVIVSNAYSVASYLEDSDHFAGLQIGGDVTAWSAPKVQLYNYMVNTRFDPTYKNGILEFSAIIRTHYLNPAQVRLFFDLKDANGEWVDSQSKYSKVKMQVSDTIYFNVPIKDVIKWSPSNPYLYNLTIKVQREMRYTEVVDFKIGFRSMEVDGDQILVNGKPEKFVGVTLQQNKIPGSTNEINTLMNRIKDAGLNSVWVSGVQDRDFYNSADSIGLYIFNSANINSSQTPSNLQYAISNNRYMVDKYLSRQMSLVESVRNYPSVVALALGDDGGNGYNMYESYLKAKKHVLQQPIIYMGATRQWNSDIYLAEGLSDKQINRYSSDLELPTILMNMDNSNIKQRWQAVDSNSDLSGIMFKNISILNENKISEKLARIDISFTESEIKVKNLRASKLDNVILKIEILQRKSYNNRSITTDSFSLKSGDSYSYSLDTKELKGEVSKMESIRCIIFNSSGDVVYRETFESDKQGKFWQNLGI